MKNGFYSWFYVLLMQCYESFARFEGYRSFLRSNLKLPWGCILQFLSKKNIYALSKRCAIILKPPKMDSTQTLMACICIVVHLLLYIMFSDHFNPLIPYYLMCSFWLFSHKFILFAVITCCFRSETAKNGFYAWFYA